MGSGKSRKIEVEAAKWSKLCGDVLQIVFERLSATDFDRAKAVCSAWRSASKESVRKRNRIPWLILFPYERSNGYSCRLLNPAETGLVYRSRKLGVEFTQSRCIATCGSWLLMYVRDPPKLYIFNPLTRERINLPPLDSRINDIIISPEDPSLMRDDLPSSREAALTEKVKDLSSDWGLAALWVDERSKDYIVLWSQSQCCLFFSKKGDNFWRMFPYVRFGLADLVYQGHRLYIYTQVFFIEMYDFSGDSPVAVTPCLYTYLPPPYLSDAFTTRTRIAVTPSGQVLMVRCHDIHNTTSCTFYVYKMNLVTEKWDHMPSLGDQALIFNLGITVPTKDIQGITPDSIYFSGPGFGTNYIFIFNLATRKVQPFIISSTRNKFFDARWFIPNV
ncbi:putative F-box protein [Cardamine amara subsp. amara]|uniref:F-box protein n=1 Tax=Cardamine amara subsp. amara TaxID=228776 RepID=A0ABD1AE78_CARAN